MKRNSRPRTPSTIVLPIYPPIKRRLSEPWLSLRSGRSTPLAGGRVDIIADENGYFYAIEVNTAPGMTTRSVFPLATEQLGIDFDDTVEAILRCA